MFQFTSKHITNTSERNQVHDTYCTGPEKVPLRSVIFAIWVLTFFIYDPVGRESPLDLGGIDILAITKIVAQFVISGVLGMTLLIYWHTFRSRGYLRRLWPLCLFAIWAMLSTLWSPLPVKTIWHAEGIMMLVMFAACAALILKDTRKLSLLLMHVSFATFVLATLGLYWQYLVQFTPPSEASRHGGFAHLNTLGILASGGLLNLIACWLMWRWRWTKLMLLPGLIVYGTLLMVTVSRIAITATSLGVGLVLLLTSRKSVVIALLTLYAASSSMYLVSSLSDSPVFDRTRNALVQYFRRGQTTEKIMTLTDRTNIWGRTIQSFLKSPIIGHGHFMISSSGTLEGFGGSERSRNPHNFFLALLTGTGLLGTILLMWGLWRILFPSIKYLISKQNRLRSEAVLVITFSFWLFIIGLLERGLLDSIKPWIVLFFVLVGLAVTIPRSFSNN